jgi:CheY-like chemotaxis protein
METASVRERPIALVVEDKPGVLDTRRQLFAQHGFQAIGALSVSDALREFRATPTIDIVVTDINLDEAQIDDKSGVALARTMRERRPNLPVVAISGYFDNLDAEERKPFNDHMLKGTLSLAGLEARLETWRNKALDYRKSRAKKARHELERLREHGVVQPNVEVLRDFLPGGRPSVDDPEEDEFMTPDDVLRKEGWRLRLVEAGFQVSALGGTVKTAIAVPLWMRDEARSVVVVLHGHSCIYHDAETAKEAVNGALELMFGYHQEFKQEPDDTVTDELQQLRDYLSKVFG